MIAESTKLPDPATSHTEAWLNHGTVYRTPLQGYVLIGASLGAVGFVLLGSIIENKSWGSKAATQREEKL